ncbi:MAG: HlyD family efflux transporter periplasmic adaptor subunit [Arachidicoccus sp.]|nr:HlyD family efflux transporter periplasmic adaptor subunit [Arachidicoccus sp.]
MPKRTVDEATIIEANSLKKVSVANFQSHSEAAQEIISRKPDFIEKWALYLFFGILLLLFAGTWFIRYPDIIQARATLSADNGPKEIMPLQTGRLIKLFVQNGQQVKQGDMLGWIESTANPDEVLKLSTQLDSSVSLLAQGKAGKVSALFTEHFQNIGTLQSSYQTYVTALQQFNDYLVNGFYARQKEMILNDMSSINQMNTALAQQKELTEKDNDLSKQTYQMNEKLFQEKVISAEEYRQEQSKLLNKQMAIPQINSSILSNQNQQRDKLKELEQLDHDVNQQKITFEQALQTLKSNVDDWEHQYVLTSPIDGTVFFNQPIQQNQFIEQGKLLGYINPSDSKFYAQIYLPQSNLGKIDTGMQVQLRFDAYPYEETGFVKGRLNYISRVASDSGYLATVQLDNGFRTYEN